MERKRERDTITTRGIERAECNMVGEKEREKGMHTIDMERDRVKRKQRTPAKRTPKMKNKELFR